MTDTFGKLLRQYRRSKRLSQKALGQSIGCTHTTIGRYEAGAVPHQSTVELLIRALQLSPLEADQLRLAAGLPMTEVVQQIPILLDPGLRRIVGLLLDLRRTRPEDAGFAETAVTLLLQGIHDALLGHLDLERVPAHLLPRRQALGPLERAVEHVLAQATPTDAQFDLLLRVARSEAWESKRRITAALPQLIPANPARAAEIMAVLREDAPHHLWRVDLRRRVAEAAPLLHPHDPTAALALLSDRPGDDQWVVVGIQEARRELGLDVTGDMTAETRYYAELLRQPARQALRRIRHDLQIDARLVRACQARTTWWTLADQPDQTLELIRYWLRRDDRGKPVEHQNVRRAAARTVVRAVKARCYPLGQGRDILDLVLSEEDVPTRRSAVECLIALPPGMAAGLLNPLLEDEDAHVADLAWQTLLTLGEFGILETV
ncbi:MAG: helix-turn-helix domain-containing protein [Chloroflexi bacterium]|nr:helix-turn-helix domain-containing protein [Chloroflexota bacterium]MBU1749099.1 helix-turn-helix domain-containing protein [Chloroflexota bacterium]